MASAGTSGQRGGLLRSLSGRLACNIIEIMWDACYVKRVGADSSPSSERPNATSRPSKTGMRSAGQPLKKSRGGRTHHRLGRRIGLLTVADGRAHLGTAGTDSRAPCAADTRSPVGDEWHHSRWAAVSASAPGILRCAGGGQLPACPPAQDLGKDTADLGWLADPSRARDQRLSFARGGQTAGTWNNCRATPLI
jgi:hypothetical protein